MLMRNRQRALRGLTVAGLMVAAMATGRCSSPTPRPPDAGAGVVTPARAVPRTGATVVPPLGGYPLVPTPSATPEGYLAPAP
jgi:hypothetical protein